MNKLRFVRRPEVEHLTGLQHTRIDELEAAGRFPKRIKISDRASGWIEAEVHQWMQERVAASRAAKAEAAAA